MISGLEQATLHDANSTVEANPESSRKLLAVFLFIPLHASQHMYSAVHLYTFLQVLIPLHDCKSTEI